MARVVTAMPDGTLSMPVLSSPELAVKSARAILAELGGPESNCDSVLVASTGAEARH
jgi:hypothetical protein